MTPQEEALSAYGLNGNDVKIEPVTTGLINVTWTIANNKDKYILQKVNDHVFKQPQAIADNVALIAEYLAAHYPRYLFVAPVKTKSNKAIVRVNGNGYFRLIPFVKSSVTIDTVQHPKQAHEAAKKFGEFTKLLAGFPVEKLKITLPDFHNLSLRYQQFLQAMHTKNEERLKESHDLIEFMLSHKQIVDTYEHILKNSSFKLRVTHHDTKISNVLFDSQDKGLCVIDLDTVMPGYFISDVGDMMRTYLSPANEEESDFSKIDVREEYFVSIWEGYMSQMKDELNAEERRHFIYSGKFMVYMQALRFLTDYLNNDVYYGAKYDRQNFVRAGNQAALLQKLIEKESLLKQLIKHK